MASQCKLVSDWGLRKWISASPYEPYGLERTSRFFPWSSYFLACSNCAQFSVCCFKFFFGKSVSIRWLLTVCFFHWRHIFIDVLLFGVRQPLGLMVIGVGLYLLLWKGDLLSVVFEMPYIQDSIIIIIACGGAILLLGCFGLIANCLANFHVFAAVRIRHQPLYSSYFSLRQMCHSSCKLTIKYVFTASLFNQ